MTSLTLSDVFHEVLLEKARVLTIARGQTQGAKVEIYTESWNALNGWIESRLCLRKGASIPMLGSFTWEFKYGGDGNVYSRPIFIMSDSFIKEHRIRRQRIHQQPNIVPPEEINYSKLAIKFSKALTKDMIFTGTRDIIKKIGDFVDRSYEFEIDFPFGTLRHKERTVRFEFNQARLAAILPENLRIGTMPQQVGGDSYDAMSEGESSNVSQAQSQSQQSSNQEPEQLLQREPRTGLGVVGGLAAVLSARGPAKSSSSSSSSSSANAGRSASAPEFDGLTMGGRKVPPLNLMPLTSADGSSNTDSQQQLQQQLLHGHGQGLPQGQHHVLLPPLSPVAAPSSSSYVNTALDFPRASVAAEPDAVLTAEGDIDLSPSAPQPRYSSSSYTPASERPLSPGLQAVLLALEEHTGAVDKVGLRNRAKARVEEAAYLKALEDVSKVAKFEEMTQDVAAAMLEQFEDGLKTKQEHEHSNKKTVKSGLFEQIDEMELRRSQERQAQRDMIAAFFLPPSAGCIENPPGSLEGGPNYKAIKHSLYNDLTYQIKSNEQRQQTKKLVALQEEKAYLDHVAMELDLQNIAERVAHLEKQKALLASWERDAHIRNLRKLQVAGSSAVKDYITINLPDAAEAEKAQKTFSIGYDPRRGKH